MKKIVSIIALAASLVSTHAMAGTLVAVSTSLGDFTLELADEKAPVTVKNFLSYVEDESYNGSIFHRVIPGFMAQGGGFTSEFTRLPTYAPIKNEADNGLANVTASIAMARTNNPNSATRQFFINYNNNDFLNYSAVNPGYAVFGQVIDGFEVVQSMAMKPTQSVGGAQDVPVEAIVIHDISVVE